MVIFTNLRVLGTGWIGLCDIFVFNINFKACNVQKMSAIAQNLYFLRFSVYLLIFVRIRNFCAGHANGRYSPISKGISHIRIHEHWLFQTLTFRFANFYCFSLWFKKIYSSLHINNLCMNHKNHWIYFILKIFPLLRLGEYCSLFI